MPPAPPTPYYTLVQTSISGKPAVVVVNTALRRYSGRAGYPWHLRVTIECVYLGDNQMPTNDEQQVIDVLGDEIFASVSDDQNAIFLARVTALGERVILCRVADPEMANSALQGLISSGEHSREWSFWMEKDEDWELARPELELLERARDVN
ncbi:DUF695 domain-containing protein [Stenotrophomonas sp.]|uniref:DUF695 domain-containing protein n=1 Tax=Stenotrophomonas sp. TaxID=69392 RepID=UPI0028B0B6AD|nr:DUF695 domain-containing protein [Stenotrophomonas sp.]